MFSLLLVVGLGAAFFFVVRRRRRVVARRDLLSTTYADRTVGFPRSKVTGRGGL